MSPAEQTRPDVAEARAAFRETMAHVEPSDLVFLDESGITTNLVRLYGRAKKGERASGTAPYGRWEPLTLFSALSITGASACMSLDGAADTDTMVAFVEQVLLPTQHKGQTVCLDNLNVHKNVHKATHVRELIEAVGCQLLFLPPYSPAFNPIEQAWSKLKALLRGVGARTKDALNIALHDVPEAITSSDARGWFKHCGYGSN